VSEIKEQGMLRQHIARWGMALAGTVLAVGPALAVGLGQPATGSPEGFEPVRALPPQEQLPAAPLLIAAYAFVWVMLLVYLWTIWRRLSAVERELADVARRVEQARRG
jgi:CcmD family protein